MAEDERKDELTAELARSRARISETFIEVRRDLDFAAKARRSFARHPAIWVGSAIAVGLVISRLFSRRPQPSPAARKVREKELEKAGVAGVLFGVLRILFGIARPFLTAWLRRLVAERFAKSDRGGMGMQ